MDINIGTQSGTDVITEVDQFIKDTVNSNNINYKLIVSDIEAGESIKGIVYVRKMLVTRNKNNPEQYNIKMLCVDGKGEIFQATLFNSSKKLKLSNQLAVISEGRKVETFDGRIYYNIDEISLYSGKGSEYITNEFLKSIDGIGVYKEQINKNLMEVNGVTYTNNIMLIMQEKNKFFDMLSQTPYKFNLGYKVGTGLRVYSQAISIKKVLMGVTHDTELTSVQIEELSKFQLLLSVQMYPNIKNMYNSYYSETYSEEKDETSPMEIWMDLFTNGLSKEIGDILTTIYTEDKTHKMGHRVKSKYPEVDELYRILDTVETSIRLEEEEQ